MQTPELILDPQLKYWVLLPISFAMVLVGLVRNNITVLLANSPKLEDFKLSREKYVQLWISWWIHILTRQFLKRAGTFRQNHYVLTKEEFEMRQKFFLDKLNTNEYFAVKEASEKQANPLTDPATNDALMNMAKGNIMNFVPQTLIMSWVNYFFAGFVIMKLPFPLTDGFKSMLQNGVATPDLDVRYVSSISWYFVNLLGLKSVYSLLMDDPAAASAMIQQQQQNQQLPNIGAPGGPDAAKMFKAEAESIQILTPESVLDGIVDRAIKKLA